LAIPLSFLRRFETHDVYGRASDQPRRQMRARHASFVMAIKEALSV
jgi:hypothetical protein